MTKKKQKTGWFTTRHMWPDLGKPTLWGLLFHVMSLNIHLTGIPWFFRLSLYKKYNPLPSFWCWSDSHTSSQLSRRNISFHPLILSLIACNGEMLTWCLCYYGNDSGLTSISVLQLACSHDQTVLQVAIDASTLSQEDTRIAVIHQQAVQHTLTVSGLVRKPRDFKRLHSIWKSLLHNHCTIKRVLFRNNVSTVLCMG